jgi:hypothetical protein
MRKSSGRTGSTPFYEYAVGNHAFNIGLTITVLIFENNAFLLSSAAGHIQEVDL